MGFQLVRTDSPDKYSMIFTSVDEMNRHKNSIFDALSLVVARR